MSINTGHPQTVICLTHEKTLNKLYGSSTVVMLCCVVGPSPKWTAPSGTSLRAPQTGHRLPPK